MHDYANISKQSFVRVQVTVETRKVGDYQYLSSLEACSICIFSRSVFIYFFFQLSFVPIPTVDDFFTLTNWFGLPAPAE